MEETEFLDRLKKEDYDKLEKELIKEYKETKRLLSRYYLGLCYSNQIKKIDDAITIFKELMNTEFKHPYMYYFVAKHSPNIGNVKIIKEGLKYFPDKFLLHEQLLLYLDNGNKEKQYQYLEGKKQVSLTIIMDMVSYYYLKTDFVKSNFFIEKIHENDEIQNINEFKFIKILLSYLAKKKIDLNLLNTFIATDDNTLIGLIVKLIEIDLEPNNKIAVQLLDHLDYMAGWEDPFICIINFEDNKPFYFTISEVFYNILKKLESKFRNEKNKRKIKLISMFQKISWDEKINKVELKVIKELIKLELKIKKDKYLYENLIEVNYLLNNKKMYFDAYIKMFENGFSYDSIISFEKFTSNEMDYVVEKVIKEVNINSFNAKLYQELIESIFSKLFSAKRYSDIVKIVNKIDYKKLNYLIFVFEVAYSFQEINQTEVAKKLYEEYLEKYPNSDATINNLGVIYEEEREFDKALEYYEKSEQIKPTDTTSKNIKRCKQLLNEINDEKEKQIEAIKFLQEENIWIIKRIKLFYNEADEYGNIICSYSKLPKVLKCNSEKAQDVLSQLLNKYYIFKNVNHNYNTSSSVYRKNTLVENKIIKLEKENIVISNLIEKMDGFTINNLNELEYNEVIAKLNLIKNKSIKKMFIRDYDELVFNYLSLQSKTVIIMCGTIVELILLYILEKKGIEKYKVSSSKKEKKVDNMNITEMLEVCASQNILHSTPQKFIDGMKQFRNFIHPGKELRDKYLELDKTTVDLSINIVNWLILTIDLE